MPPEKNNAKHPAEKKCYTADSMWMGLLALVVSEYGNFRFTDRGHCLRKDQRIIFATGLAFTASRR